MDGQQNTEKEQDYDVFSGLHEGTRPGPSLGGRDSVTITDSFQTRAPLRRRNQPITS
jgi:hypothetical protein